MIEKNGEKLGIIGCCIKGLAPHSLIVATENTYGIYQPDIKQLLKQIQSLKGKLRHLIVMPHWGEEHIFFPPYQCVQYAQMMIDAGVDGIFGSHSHCISAIHTYKNKPVFFGMGNFLYPDICLKPPRPFYYPESVSELQGLGKCINYPKSVKRPTVSIWSEDSRIGIAAETEIKKDIKVKRKLVRMGNDNILRFYNEDAQMKNAIVNSVLLPIASFVSSPLVYMVIHRVVWKFARLKLRHLGDFRKDLP